MKRLIQKSKMGNMLEELKKYFETTPREKVLEDWAKTEAFDQVGPTMDEFLTQTRLYYQVYSSDPLQGYLINNIEYSPKYSSGFFLSNTIKLCKKQRFQ